MLTWGIWIKDNQEFFILALSCKPEVFSSQNLKNVVKKLVGRKPFNRKDSTMDWMFVSFPHAYIEALTST